MIIIFITALHRGQGDVVALGEADDGVKIGIGLSKGRPFLPFT